MEGVRIHASAIRIGPELLTIGMARDKRSDIRTRRKLTLCLAKLTG
jgi:hypothetical protein